MAMGSELDAILTLKNGRLVPDMHKHSKIIYPPEVLEFKQSTAGKINKQCDIYSIGAILYRMLIGTPPPHEVSEHISKKRLNQRSPTSNVYEVPYFFQGYILSNDMCYVMVKLLHQEQKHRYTSLAQVKTDLINLRDNIYSTPPMLRRLLGHPVLPSESMLLLT